ncbi:hypothetical protein EB118_06375 [bacterium]|nr:hypothetical protein [bacterium]NDC94383.1 hypothetical protein [bacterium]NDD83914.1 hypothetical protein [bacterium]NDG29704.1 hypothetical protein [bacterium]
MSTLFYFNINHANGNRIKPIVLTVDVNSNEFVYTVAKSVYNNSQTSTDFFLTNNKRKGCMQMVCTIEHGGTGFVEYLVLTKKGSIQVEKVLKLLKNNMFDYHESKRNDFCVNTTLLYN